MPINSLGDMVEYTSNEDIQYLMEEEGTDYSVEFVGYLEEVLGYSKSADGKPLFKATITNGFKRICLLIWDTDTVQHLVKNFIAGAIVHLDGCQGRIVQPRKIHDTQKLLNYEITIHPTSKVLFKGFHVRVAVQNTPNVSAIELADVAKATGEIKVKAYLKTVVARAYNKDGEMHFGQGSLTDKVHKLNVNNFKPEDVPKTMVKGVCVLVKGVVSREGKLRIICRSMADIQVLPEESTITEKEVTSANKPLKRWNPEHSREDNVKKAKKIQDEPKVTENDQNSSSPMNISE
ncbi:uncharacterized protein LOC131675542 [Phymastichus coffea]|uniref:uncharacterized protein LOC131675542 n=1 Tax=Phymastichus coffea TaxID=108790 RepID=UPI00273CBC0A|nr:uncharacterized protein LOC131675542 [Phymastichus coffea]